MFFVASASIAAEHPDLEPAIESLDAHIAAVGQAGIRHELAADFVGQEPETVERLLKEFARLGVLVAEIAYVCPVCDHVLAKTRDGRELWCDICERTQSLRGKDLAGCTVYRVRADAERTPEIPAGTGSAAATEAEVVFILIVAGDRGGGQRAQLDQPAEQKALHRAIAEADNGDSFAFAQPLFAAEPGGLVKGVEAGAGILHFVGHGTDRRLVLIDPALPLASHAVTPERLEQLLRHAPQRIRLAFFNTCDSEAIARHLASSNVVEAAIGWPGKVNDNHAIQYVEVFYRLACSGKPLEQAMQMAAVCLGETLLSPQLFVANGLDPHKYVIVRSD